MSIIDYSDRPINENLISNFQPFSNKIIIDYTKLFEELINQESKNKA